MKKDKKSSSLKKKIVGVGLGFLFFVFIIASLFGKRGLIEIYRTQQKKKVLLRKIEQLEAKKSQLERDIEELRNNPNAVEKKAREKLGLVKKDEIVIIDKKKR